MRVLNVVLFCIFNTILCFAQQPSQYTLHSLNLAALNPAYAGIEPFFQANALVRHQWNGLSGSPQSQILNVNLPIKSISSGAGINIENDQLGLQQTIQASLCYSYHLRLNRVNLLSFGLRGGFGQMGWNGTNIRTPDGKYLNAGIDHKDEILPSVFFSGRFPVLDAGLLYQRNFVKLGIGIKNLTQNSIKYTINNGKIRLVTNYFFTFATEIEIREQYKVMPSVLFRTDLAESQLDVTLISELYRKFNVGVGYRGWSNLSNDALSLIAGFRLNEKIRLIYSYDINLSPLKSSNNGSNELMLQYNLNKSIGKAIPERIIYNPRYF
ncbi:MAG: PorP/SprF family type IX secretion system membrane protein [Saprospiraceae bacterium]